MRRIFLFPVILFMALHTAYAQEYMLISGGERLKVNIVSIDSASVLFRLTKFSDTTLYVISKENIQGIFFDRELFDNTSGIEFMDDPPYKSVTALRKPEYINLKNAEPVKVFIDTITYKQVLFRTANTDDTTLYSLAKKDIEHITFKEIASDKVALTDKSGVTLEQKAAIDARENYKAHYGAAAVSYAAGLVFFYLVPILVPLTFSFTEPNEIYMSYPDTKLAQKPAYAGSYKRTARSMKTSAVWTGFALGVTTDVILFIYFISNFRY